ncbi:fibroblast growth factor 5 isoform X2 [Equus asinus]|uniref:Fibroblast growth factor n=1 Tax=Equus przewalskii TaxID=9798 RepID=A0ABM4NV64_EQUPR|nr:fibroblast growth factor 5 isoform X2 [Equus asinus]
MSLSFLLLFLSHLILSAWAHGEKRLAPKGQPGPVATDRNPRGASSSRSGSSTTSSSSSSASSSPAASLGSQASGLEQGSFQWSPSGRRTGSLYCRVGIGFHLQIYPDGKVNGSHEANMLSILEIFAVSQGIVGIRGVFSNKFLAMSKKGKLHASRVPAGLPRMSVWTGLPALGAE